MITNPDKRIFTSYFLKWSGERMPKSWRVGENEKKFDK